MRTGRLVTMSVLLALGLIAAPLWADEGTAKPTTTVEGRVTEGKDGGAHVRVYTVKDGKGHSSVMVDVGKAKKPAVRYHVKADAGKSDGGWMGINVSPVPAALAHHFGLKTRGVMVRNVVKGSPADKAGLERYDVILALDKDDAPADVDKFVHRIGKHKPGDTLELIILRTGDKKSARVVLGKPIGLDKAEYVYETDEDEVWQDAFKLHRGLIRKGDGGWVIVGPQGEIKLPMEIRKLMPGRAVSNIEVKVDRGGAKASFKLRRSVDGKTIELESKRDGGIEVRGTEEGKRTVITYKNAEELKKKDPEAYELYKGITRTEGGVSVTVQGVEPGGPHVVLPRVMGKEYRDIEKDLRQWIEKTREQAMSARRRVAQSLGAGEPKREFKVDEKGRIEVKIREGDSAATVTFKSEDELKEKSPKLYGYYKKLLHEE